MSVIYSQHSTSSVFVGPTGHSHARADADDGHTPFALECAVCEPYLVKEGWVYNPELVPLTDVQTREKERQTREGNLAVKQAAEQLASIASAGVRNATVATVQKVLHTDKPKRTISAEQLAAMAEGRRRAAAAKST